MFERRLKILLMILFLITGVIALRAAHITIIQHDHWTAQAAEAMKRSTYIEPTRGRILDYKGEELAVDLPCTDVAVDYRAIVAEPDKRWLTNKAASRLRQREGSAYTEADRSVRRQMLADEIERVKADLDRMWDVLAEVSGQTRQEIEEVRNAIVQRVEMRKRYIWYANYRQALKEHEQADPPPFWQKWLLGDAADGPRLDQFQVEVAEESQAHVILSDVNQETVNYLGKNIDAFPGLVLRPGVHRVYPHGDAACHVLGHLAKVTREDLTNDPNRDDPLRKYWPNDLIGRSGLEALAEPTLRGSRGRLTRKLGETEAMQDAAPIPGKDVTITIDIVLQKQIQAAFEKATIPGPTRNDPPEVHEMHGAAVVIDVATGEVRAMVSYPTYDLNKFEELYPQMIRDDINNRLLNRATQYPLEPGSTVKPLVGLGAITDGLIEHDGTIECTGYLVLGGKRYKVGRCWVASKFGSVLGENGVAHHPIPWDDPHPNGHLNLSDALQRSCNIYFETLADEMGLEGLSKWYRRFGLGRPVGLGIPESVGRLPDGYRGPADVRRSTTWFAGIGQGHVAATPIQLANATATIARDGLWIRPTLVTPGTKIDERLIRRGEGEFAADRVDLNLDPAGVRMAKDGMVRVANTKAGTGNKVKRSDLVVAAKTGTAQAAKFSVPLRDDKGDFVRDEKGAIVRRVLEPSKYQHPNPEAVWYRGWGNEGTDLNHGWIVGYAPADRPQIAFAVMVEYGGSGGATAAGIAQKMLEACIEHGYLTRTQTTELLQDVAMSDVMVGQ